jgi:flagellar assembly factor FliW
MSAAMTKMTEMTTPSQLPVIELVHPMPGFPEAHAFSYAHLDETGVLGEMRCLDEARLKFLTVLSNAFRPEYAPEIDDDVARELGIEDVNQVLVLLVVHAGTTLATTTVNLRAPLIINTTSGLGAQVILDDPSLAVDAPLIP